MPSLIYLIAYIIAATLLVEVTLTLIFNRVGTIAAICSSLSDELAHFHVKGRIDEIGHFDILSVPRGRASSLITATSAQTVSVVTLFAHDHH